MKNDRPLFSVIISTYDRPRYLRQAVDSVLKQTVADFECLVVDDHSPEPAQPFEDPRVRIVRRAANGGQSAALNTGLAEARGRYVAFLDDDDLMTPERLRLAMDGFGDAPASICLSGRVGSPPRVAGRPRILNGDVSRTIREGMTPNVGQTAVERRRVPRFDESLRASADVEWWIRLAKQCEVKTVEEVGFLYRSHDEARHNNPSSRRVDALLRIYEMHRGYFDSNPKATAFHLRRVGLCALRARRPAVAARMLARSLRHRMHPKTGWHLLRACIRALRP